MRLLLAALMLSISFFVHANYQLSPQFADGIFELALPPVSHDMQDVDYQVEEIHGQLSPSGRFVFASRMPHLFTNEGSLVYLAQAQYFWDLTELVPNGRITEIFPNLELGISSEASGAFSFSPDEQTIAFQYADNLSIFSVPEFEILTNAIVSAIDASVRDSLARRNSHSLIWSPDGESIVTITDQAYLLNREGEILGMRDLDEWAEIPEFSTYFISPNSESLIFWFVPEPSLFISCDWQLEDCRANGQGQVGSSLLVMNDGQEVISLLEADNSSLIVWEQANGNNYNRQAEPIQVSAEVFELRANASGEYILAGAYANGTSESGIVIQYPSGEEINYFSFEGFFDFHWLPDGEHFITLDASIDRIELRLYRLAQAEPLDYLILTLDDGIDDFEFNHDFISIAGLSDDGQRILISLGGTLVLIPISWQ